MPSGSETFVQELSVRSVGSNAGWLVGRPLPSGQDRGLKLELFCGSENHVTPGENDGWVPTVSQICNASCLSYTLVGVIHTARSLFALWF